MVDVANGARGSARNALSIGHLGFRVAAKTGSADIQGRNDAEDPRERLVR